MSTILIVDDHILNRHFLKALLGFDNHRVIEAADGAEGLSLATANRPDLIISDIMMPLMDGYEFVNRLRADPDLAAIPVIFFTSTYSMREAEAIAATCGVRWVLQKPSPPKLILKAVLEALGQPPLAQDIPPLQAPSTNVEADAISNGGQLAGYLRELNANSTLALQLQTGIHTSSGDPGQGQVAQRLSQSLADFQGVSLRLTSLINMGIELGSERDPQRLLDTGCRIARHIGVATCAVIGIVEPGATHYVEFAARGLEQQCAEQLAALPPPVGIFQSVLHQRRPQRLHGLDGDPTRAGLPNCHVPIESLLVVPIATAGQTYGWLYLSDKIGSDQFNDVDAEVVTAVARQIAVAYENLNLFERLRLNLAQVERDNLERRKMEAKLQQSETQFRQLAENIRDVFFLFDAAGKQVLYISPAYEEIWGQSCASLYSQPESWLTSIHPEDQVAAHHHFSRGVQAGAFDMEYRIVRTDASIRWIKSRGFPVAGGGGELVRIAGIAEDITDRRLAQQELQLSLAEKEALLKEVHHRVKNNLQVITSLLRLESGRNTEINTKTVLADMQARIRSMALLHESLYREGTFASVDLGAYLKQLVFQAFRAMGTPANAVALRLDLASVQVGMDQATPCGLLVNELISNCLKHGFPDGRHGQLQVQLQSVEAGAALLLTVADNGVGLADDFDILQGKSLGLQLVADLVRQIGGTLHIGSGPGAVFDVHFPVDSLSPLAHRA